MTSDEIRKYVPFHNGFRSSQSHVCHTHGNMLYTHCSSHSQLGTVLTPSAIWPCLEAFLVVTLEVGATGTWQVGATEADHRPDHRPAVPRTAPPHRAIRPKLTLVLRLRMSRFYLFIFNSLSCLDCDSSRSLARREESFKVAGVPELYFIFRYPSTCQSAWCIEVSPAGCFKCIGDLLIMGEGHLT